MSDENNNNSNSGATGGSGGKKPSTSGQRIGRIGQWGASSSAPSNSPSGSGPRFATLRDLAASSGSGNPPSRGSDSSDNDKEGQTFFAGGEKSGLSVQNPNRRGNGAGPAGDLVKNLLEKATEASISSDTTAAPRGAFSGAGHTLGSDEVESRIVPDPTAVPPSEEERILRRIIFWRNGFSVEDGPLFSFTDPANAEILRAIDSGQAPPELLNVRYGQPVELRIVRRMNEDYVEPDSHPHHAFEGAGHRLGAPTPPIAGQVSGSGGPIVASSSAAPVTSSRADEAERVQTKFEVDQSQPTTSIRLHFANGTRMLCRMNLSHTISDIRSFINASSPENLTRPYTISTMHPMRVLEDDTQTIEAAGLMNCVVVQRWASGAQLDCVLDPH